MNSMIMYGIALASVVIVVVMLIHKMDIKITLFVMGVILMYITKFTGNSIGGESFQSSGLSVLDPLVIILNEFKSSLNSAGFIIMILGGYTSFMSAIGANEITVNTLTKPIRKIKSVYILVPVVFIIGNMLSLVLPSASNLAIILLATLYPVLRQSGMTPLTTAAVIATTATVYVSGLKSIGLISSLQTTMIEIQGSGLGFILPLILVGLTTLIVLLSGSGTALFYALVPLMMPLAMAAGISALAVTIPMALAGNIIRAVSPVSAVIIIVAGTVKVSPLDIVRRTWLPMLSGVVFMFVLSMILFL